MGSVASSAALMGQRLRHGVCGRFSKTKIEGESLGQRPRSRRSRFVGRQGERSHRRWCLYGVVCQPPCGCCWLFWNVAVTAELAVVSNVPSNRLPDHTGFRRSFLYADISGATG